MDPKITLIAAVARNGIIGRGGRLPWHLPTDLRRFKALTLGKPVIMGRRTYQSLGGPLPGRHLVVITRDEGFSAEGVDVAWSLDEGLRLASARARQLGAEEVVVAGGADLYAQALGAARLFYKTEVHLEPDGDTRFPDLGSGWRERSRTFVAAGPRDDADMTFVELERGP